MTRPRAWVLNYGAEAELAGRAGGKVGFSGPPAWLGDQDVVIDPAARGLPREAESLSGFDGAAWCPTEDALRLLRAAGVPRLPVAPPQGVLRRANARDQFADLHPLVAVGAEIGVTASEVEALVGRTAPLRSSGRAPAWLLRTVLSASGQGRRLVECWDDATDAWVHRALTQGPLHVMPMVDVVEEFSCHAYLRSNGEVLLGQHVTQSVRGGAWRAAEARGEPIVALNQARERIIERLRSMGYYGPLGVDGFLWRDAKQTDHVAAGTDINARYTMSMGAAFGFVPTEYDGAAPLL